MSHHPAAPKPSGEPAGAFLMTYFLTEKGHDGEQVRFAVSEPGDPTRWAALNSGAPILVSDVGENGVRDPFVVRDEANDRVIVIATDLRIYPDDGWTRSVLHGSRSIVIWESTDLVTWSAPRLVQVSGPDAGNTWAPKVFWSDERDCWLVIWASAIYGADDDRQQVSHQRLMAATTSDFREFGPPFVYLDAGHDVIDATFLRDGDDWYRFSANAHGTDKSRDIGHHIFSERGSSLEDPAFAPLVVDIGKDVMVRGEGPATFADPSTGRWYLLIDEFGLRGYHLFETDDLSSGAWTHRPDAMLPEGARHGSVIPISLEERQRLLDRL